MCRTMFAARRAVRSGTQLCNQPSMVFEVVRSRFDAICRSKWMRRGFCEISASETVLSNVVATASLARFSS